MEVKRVCNLCEAMCGLIIETSDTGSVSKIRANPDDVFSQGAYCPKSQGLKDLLEDEDRIKTPLKKVAGEFVEVSWKEAFDEIADKVKSIQAKHGRSSMDFTLSAISSKAFFSARLFFFFVAS